MPSIWTEDDFMKPLLDSAGTTLFDPLRSARMQNLALTQAQHELNLKKAAELDALSKSSEDAQVGLFKLQDARERFRVLNGRYPDDPELGAFMGGGAPMPINDPNITPQPSAQLAGAEQKSATANIQYSARKGDLPGAQKQAAAGVGYAGGAESPEGSRNIDILSGNKAQPLSTYAPDQGKVNDAELSRLEEKARTGKAVLTRDEAIRADQLLGGAGAWKIEGGNRMFVPREASAKYPALENIIQSYKKGEAPGAVKTAPETAPAAGAGTSAPSPGVPGAPASAAFAERGPGPEVGTVADVPGRTLKEIRDLQGTELHKNTASDLQAYQRAIDDLKSNDPRRQKMALEQIAAISSPTAKASTAGIKTLDQSEVAAWVKQLATGSPLTPTDRTKLAETARANYNIGAQLANDQFGRLAPVYKRMGLEPSDILPNYPIFNEPDPAFQVSTGSARTKVPAAAPAVVAPTRKRDDQVDAFGSRFGLW